MEPKHKLNVKYEVRLTRRGKIVVGILWLAAVAVLSSVPALWWTDNPISVR